MVPKAQEGPMVHRQHHLQAPLLKAMHHLPTLRQEYLQLQIRLLCPKLYP